MPGVETVGQKNKENDEIIDFEDAEYQRQLLRPVEIKEDVKLMEQRQRVSRILHSDAFHRELNKILDHQLQEGAVCGGLAGSANESNAAAALQEISNLLLPQARLGCSVFNRGATMPIIPINDIRSIDTNISKQEKFLRCKLAAVYRLIDLHGWASGMMLHASLRISRDLDTFLANCHGFMNHEITARNLVKVDLNGEVEEGHGIIDQASWVLHAAVHKADVSMKCVVHIKTPSVVAVSCMRSGLLAVSEEALRLGTVPMYEWGSSSIDMDGTQRLVVEQEALGRCLGNNRCVLVRNQGLLARGKSIEEAWRIGAIAVHACEIQVRLAAVIGSTNVLVAAKEDNIKIDEHEADLHFEALMRALDAAGHHTGYLYRYVPIIVDRKRRVHMQQQTEDGHLADMEDEADEEDVEIPPSATSFSTGDDLVSTTTTNSLSASTKKKAQQWHVHIPNDYVREEIDEPVGSHSSRKMVSWRQVSPDKRQTSGLVEMSSSPNQFAPQGTDPNELKHQQQKVKAKYFRDETSAGHQSRILRSLDTPDSATTVAPMDEDVGSRVVLVGAVSRGIIDKQHRHDPSVYQSCFSPNPFDRMTDEDLQQYQKRIDRLTLGLPPIEDESKSEYLATDEGLQRQMSPGSTTEAACSSPVPDRDAEIVAATVHHEEQCPPTSGTAGPSDSLSPGHAENIRSDTSGADMSHDDTEREGQKSATTAGGKKKKRSKLKDMFSFGKKSKSKGKTE